MAVHVNYLLLCLCLAFHVNSLLLCLCMTLHVYSLLLCLCMTVHVNSLLLCICIIVNVNSPLLCLCMAVHVNSLPILIFINCISFFKNNSTVHINGVAMSANSSHEVFVCQYMFIIFLTMSLYGSSCKFSFLQCLA